MGKKANEELVRDACSALRCDVERLFEKAHTWKYSKRDGKVISHAARNFARKRKVPDWVVKFLEGNYHMAPAIG